MCRLARQFATGWQSLQISNIISYVEQPGRSEWVCPMPEPMQRSRRPPRPDRELAAAVKASKAPAISRAAAVLRLLGKSDAPLGVQSIARELGLVPSTCLHVLRALVAEEFVSFDPDTKRYSLEAGVLTLARHWLRRNRFNDLAQPVLDRIAQEFDVTMLGVHIVGLEHIIVVAVSQSGPSFQLSTQIGSRFPALISATGRCIAAFGGHTEDRARSPVQDAALGRAANARRMERAGSPDTRSRSRPGCGQLHIRGHGACRPGLQDAHQAEPCAGRHRYRQCAAAKRSWLRFRRPCIAAAQTLSTQL